MKTFRMLVGGIALVATMTATVATVAVKAEAGAAGQVRATATIKGALKTISDEAVVIVPSDNKKIETSFIVSATTTKTGALAAGDQVTVTYYFDAGKRVATAVAGKVAK